MTVDEGTFRGRKVVKVKKRVCVKYKYFFVPSPQTPHPFDLILKIVERGLCLSGSRDPGCLGDWVRGVLRCRIPEGRDPLSRRVVREGRVHGYMKHVV